MVFLTTKSVLDAVMLEVTDNSDAMRVKALAWLNQAVRDVLNQPRAWKFLEAVEVLSISNNQITLPAPASEVVYLKVGDSMFVPHDQLSDLEALDGCVGYTRDTDGTITFEPGASGSCELKYETGLNTKYADSEDSTIFPVELENLLISGTLLRCFKYDKDGRFPAETELFKYQMSLAKSWDNRLKPLPKNDTHGYIRITAAHIANSMGAGGSASIMYSNTIQATDGNFYELQIVDNGDGTFSHIFTRVA